MEFLDGFLNCGGTELYDLLFGASNSLPGISDPSEQFASVA